MAKDKSQRIRSESPAQVDDGSFRISKRKIGKPKLVTVTFQLTELQEAHLSYITDQNSVARAEFCKQAVAYALTKLNAPFTEPGQESDEVKEQLAKNRQKRAERREKMGSDEDD